MVVNYRAFNKQIIKNRCPLPKIDDIFDQLASTQIFHFLDLAQGYHQILILDENAPKMAFSVPFGHYQFKVLSFGLTNSPATFQGVMNQIFHKYFDKFVLVYLDDILVFSINEEDDVAHTSKVLNILHKH